MGFIDRFMSRGIDIPEDQLEADTQVSMTADQAQQIRQGRQAAMQELADITGGPVVITGDLGGQYAGPQHDREAGA